MHDIEKVLACRQIRWHFSDESPRIAASELFEHPVMLIKSIVTIVFILILASLGSALFHLVKHKDREHSAKTAKALTVRIALSLILFIFVFIAFALGLFKPEGIGSRMHRPVQHNMPSQLPQVPTQPNP